MKKILSALVLISFLTVLLVPVVVSAQEAPRECCALKRAIKLDTAECFAGEVAAPTVAAAGDCLGGYCADSAAKWGMFCLRNTLYNITDWIFVILVALAGLMVIIGAFTLLMAAGNPEKVTSGRNYILYAAIGLIVGFLAKAIPNLVKMVSGM
jgi:hypothetical protein